MKIPKKIHILGTEWDIVTIQHPKKCKALGNGKDLGSADNATRTITLDSTTTIVDEVLYHEVVHAILAISGVTNMIDNCIEEAIADCIGSALTQIVNLKD